jgi:micrococcal nuclease
VGRRRKAVPLAVAILALLVWLARNYTDFLTPKPAPSGEWRVVVRVIDGDTLELDGAERVRLIGVNTPESVDPRRPVEYFGKEASAFTRRLAQGKRARLEYDRERQDRYGRTLAYVHLEDGTFLNAEIIRQGYGQAYTRFPFRYAEQFRAYEREARENRRGLWAE